MCFVSTGGGWIAAVLIHGAFHVSYHEQSVLILLETPREPFIYQHDMLGGWIEF